MKVAALARRLDVIPELLSCSLEFGLALPNAESNGRRREHFAKSDEPCPTRRAPRSEPLGELHNLAHQ